MSSGAEVIHSSFWGGDLEGLVLQGAPRGLFQKHIVVLSAGEPAISTGWALRFQKARSSVRAVHSVRSHPTRRSHVGLNAYQERYQVAPNYASYKMGDPRAEGGVRKGGRGATDTGADHRCVRGLTFEGPGGPVRMTLGKGHQAVMDAAVGTAKHVGGELQIVDIKRYPADKVNPPEAVKSEAWIKSGFKSR